MTKDADCEDFSVSFYWLLWNNELNIITEACRAFFTNTWLIYIDRDPWIQLSWIEKESELIHVFLQTNIKEVEGFLKNKKEVCHVNSTE